jgi:hypothetical protein
MTKISNYLKNKTNKDEEYVDTGEGKYRFIVTASDGSHLKTYDDLDVFAKGWMNGKLSAGRMVTDFGDTIYPENRATEKAIDAYILLRDTLLKFNITAESEKILLEFNGLKFEDVANLIISDDKYIETDKGRTFLLEQDSEYYKNIVHNDDHMKKVGLPEGSMSLQDVAVMIDSIHNICLVTDLRKEAVEIVDLVSRSLNKNKILNVEETYCDEDCVQPDLNIINNVFIASDTYLDSVKSKIIKLEKQNYYDNGIEITEGGYTNSKESPVIQYDLSDMQRKGLLTVDYTARTNNSESEYIYDVSVVTKDLVSALGGKERGLYVSLGDNDKVSFVELGSKLKHKFDSSNVQTNILPLTDNDIESKNLKIVKINNKNRFKDIPF